MTEADGKIGEFESVEELLWAMDAERARLAAELKAVQDTYDATARLINMMQSEGPE